MKPIFILCADIHLRWKIPSCRKNTFFRSMWKKLKFLSKLEEKYGCPVLNAGDTFDTWRSDKDSLMIEWLNMAAQLLPKSFTTIYGQHEMPNHSEENKIRSPLELLGRIGRIRIIPNGSYWQHQNWSVYGSGYGHNVPIKGNPNSILLMHKMVWTGEPPFPGAPAEGNALRVMETNPGHRLIFCGDNHSPFSVVHPEHRYRVLINGGSMMRTTTLQKTYKPVIWLFFKDSGFKQIPYPIEEDVWEEENKSIEVLGKNFEIVKTINEVNGVSNDFNSNVVKCLSDCPHPVKVKARSLLKESV